MTDKNIQCNLFARLLAQEEKGKKEELCAGALYVEKRESDF